MGIDLNKLKQDLAKEAFGLTKEEALKQHICINCKKSVEGRIKTEAGAREYQLSAMCEICFDELFKEEDE